MSITTTELHDELRAWARGLTTLMAATELLIRAFDGRYARPGSPWIKPVDGGHWIDFEALWDHSGAWSGGEQRMIAVVLSLGAGWTVDLSDVASGVDHDNLDLVLAAIAHVCDKGQPLQSLGVDHDTNTLQHITFPPLHPWPSTAGEHSPS